MKKTFNDCALLSIQGAFTYAAWGLIKQGVDKQTAIKIFDNTYEHVLNKMADENTVKLREDYQKLNTTEP